MPKIDTSALVAAFLAKGGAVNAVSAGQRVTTEREMRLACCDGDGESALIAERHVVVDHAGRERVRNGLGEWIA